MKKLDVGSLFERRGSLNVEKVQVVRALRFALLSAALLLVVCVAGIVVTRLWNRQRDEQLTTAQQRLEEIPESSPSPPTSTPLPPPTSTPRPPSATPTPLNAAAGRVEMVADMSDVPDSNQPVAVSVRLVVRCAYECEALGVPLTVRLVGKSGYELLTETLWQTDVVEEAEWQVETSVVVDPMQGRGGVKWTVEIEGVEDSVILPWTTGQEMSREIGYVDVETDAADTASAIDDPSED